MSLLLGAAIGAAGSVLGSVIGSRASSASNAQALAFSRAQAQNKYQWAVKDMEKAGLNPKLAGVQAAGVSAGGTPSLRDPGVAISSGANTAANILANAVMTMSSARKNLADAVLASEQAHTQASARAQLEADASLKRQHELLALAQTTQTRAQTAKTKAEKYYWEWEGSRVNEIYQRERWRNDFVERYRLAGQEDYWRNYQDLLGGLEVFGSAAKDAAQVYEHTLGGIIKRLVPNISGLTKLRAPTTGKIRRK